VTLKFLNAQRQLGWAERTVNVDLQRDAIKSAPAFDPSGGIGRDYEAQLFRHYGRRGYWHRHRATPA
jgi:hypothetical protein